MVATVVSQNVLTLAQIAKQTGPDGKIMAVADLLSQDNEILEDLMFMEGNGMANHTVAVRTSLPTIYTRRFNQGVPVSVSQTGNLVFDYTLVSAQSQIDEKEVKLGGNEAAVRANEDLAFIEALNQKIAYNLFYGNPINDPLQFRGLLPIYNNLNATQNNNANNIIDCGGTGSASNASIYLVGWGENTVYCPYPKGTPGGLEVLNRGSVPVNDAAGLRYFAYVTEYNWNFGLAIKDWRYVVRAANIAVNSSNSSVVAADLIAIMVKMLNKVPSLNRAKFAFYMNRTLFSALQIEAMNRSGNALCITEAVSQFGRPQKWLEFQGIPLRRVDMMTNTESQATLTSV